MYLGYHHRRRCSDRCHCPLRRPPRRTPSSRPAAHPPIQFESGGDRITLESVPTLDRLADFLGFESAIRVQIIGHTDSIGSVPYNMQLSLDRAESVKGFMVDRGIDEERMSTDGKGPLLPIDPNRTEEGRARNRRVQVVVIR